MFSGNEFWCWLILKWKFMLQLNFLIMILSWCTILGKFESICISNALKTLELWTLKSFSSLLGMKEWVCSYLAFYTVKLPILYILFTTEFLSVDSLYWVFSKKISVTWKCSKSSTLIKHIQYSTVMVWNYDSLITKCFTFFFCQSCNRLDFRRSLVSFLPQKRRLDVWTTNHVCDINS